MTLRFTGHAVPTVPKKAFFPKVSYRPSTREKKGKGLVLVLLALVLSHDVSTYPSAGRASEAMESLGTAKTPLLRPSRHGAFPRSGALRPPGLTKSRWKHLNLLIYKVITISRIKIATSAPVGSMQLNP